MERYQSFVLNMSIFLSHSHRSEFCVHYMYHVFGVILPKKLQLSGFL